MATNFINQTWTTTGQAVNDVTDAGTKITVYTSTDYDTYVTFLSSEEATTIGASGSGATSADTLASFKTEVEKYGDYAIHVEVTGTALETDKEAAFCIAQADYGMSCADVTVTIPADGSAATMAYASYWWA